MEMVNFTIKMDLIIKVNFKMIVGMETEIVNIATEMSILVNGKMINIMVKENTYIKMEKSMKGFGIMAT
jgi:hypothetical protein